MVGFEKTPDGNTRLEEDDHGSKCDTAMTELSSLGAALGGMNVISDLEARRRKSRDFYWYSPVLKRQLDDDNTHYCDPQGVRPLREAIALDMGARRSLAARV